MKEQPLLVDDKRSGMKAENLKQAITEHLRYVVSKDADSATEMDCFTAIAYTVRDRILERWLNSKKSL